MVLLASIKALKNDEKCFVYHLKNSFRSQNNCVFVRIFSVMQKDCLTRKLRLISKLMTLSTEKQIITKHRKPNISRIKGNHTMKFGQLIKYNMKKTFLQRSCKK